ncbi:MAG: hypothetical protein Q9227_001392 [Pyrenula ochraceoflavens]
MKQLGAQFTPVKTPSKAKTRDPLLESFPVGSVDPAQETRASLVLRSTAIHDSLESNFTALLAILNKFGQAANGPAPSNSFQTCVTGMA